MTDGADPPREDPRLTPPIIIANMRGQMGRVHRLLTEQEVQPDDDLVFAACAFASEALGDLQVILLNRMKKHD